MADDDRAMRAKIRATIKRDAAMRRIVEMHALAERLEREEEMIPQFLIALRDLDSLWDEFCVENDSVLDAMIALDKSSDFSSDVEMKLRNLVLRIRVIGEKILCSHKDEILDRDQHDHRLIRSVSKLSLHSNHNELTGQIPCFSNLPVIPLPKFNGEIQSWPVFRDRFFALVDKRPNLSNIDKFYYLLGCLEGNSSEVIKGIIVSADTYKLAWDTLVDRYDKPRQLAASLIDKLLLATEASQETQSSLNGFLNLFDENISLLQSLKIPDMGSFILFVLASRSLPISTRKLFESSNASEYPDVQDIIKFVKLRVNVLANACFQPSASSNSKSSPVVGPSKFKKGQFQKVGNRLIAMVSTKATTTKCLYCDKNHFITDCSKFLQISVDDRYKFITGLRLCLVCFDSSHWANNCRFSCSICSRRHHTLLHRKEESRKHDSQAHSSLLGHHKSTSVLLGTALVHVKDINGVLHSVRALVDSASQISAITQSCIERLGLRCSKWTVPVTGLSGQRVPDIKGKSQFNVQPRDKCTPLVSVEAWVLPNITGYMPASQLSPNVRSKCRHLVLADPQFDIPGPIDLLLGADVFPQIWGDSSLSLGKDFPMAYNSTFGWVLIGPVHNNIMELPQTALVTLTSSMESMMEKFWAIEEPSAAPANFTEDGRCEYIFQQEVCRDDQGRFVVPLPLRQDHPTNAFMGAKQIAMKRYEHLERKLVQDPVLYDSYRTFMAEYESLGHMSLASQPGKYIIPHHGVHKITGTELKLRVVFDGSARCTTGWSLNDCLYPGPKLQMDVVDILIGFRTYCIAFTTDICKMYRQFLIHPKYRTYQHIYWRAFPHEELKEFELNTVTYGLNCAPYLALRVLREIAENVKDQYPHISRALYTQTYMDDICIGADSVKQALQIQSDLTKTLGEYGLELKKWTSNSYEVLSAVPEDSRATGSLSLGEGDTVPVLGMAWNPDLDCFTYDVSSIKVVLSKRGVLSVIARIFDPLGFVSPVIFLAKNLMQKIWQSKVSWDDKLPPEIVEDWKRFVGELPQISLINIPRHVGTLSNQQYRICGFSDASEKGYAAVVYLHITDIEDNVKVFFLGAKTKLAPMKPSTVPRLELCGAELLSVWLTRIKKRLEEQLVLSGIYAWTDSTIILSWLTNPHIKFKVFVSNRVHKILKLLPECQWAYVRSTDNPADCASRGLWPSELKSYELYWSGPSFLNKPFDSWNFNLPKVQLDQLPELQTSSLVVNVVPPEAEWFNRFSSYTHMLRVTAWMRRYICCMRKKSVEKGFLTRGEINDALLSIVRNSQQICFEKLLRELSAQKPISVKGLRRLCPFIDDQGVIRVGGRLRNSNLSENRKYPILISKNSYLASLVARHWHLYACHAGPRLMTSLIQSQFWMLSIRQIVHRVIRSCTICVRLNGTNLQPIMADLPSVRVQKCRPFSSVGVDYAGPLRMKELSLRKSREYKIYIAVFVCMSIKAIHLEIVRDLSTDAFLAALDRFIARRGLPVAIYSDCGTNFVGASKQLFKLVNHPDNQEVLSSAKPCVWHFNPPSAPHFGGLWEAAVRSLKLLLTRVMGNHQLTLEEMSTVLCRIEATLNSRPLVPLSSDPHDLECLTPGHFLIGQPLISVPESTVDLSCMNLRNRWKLLHQCNQHFWKRWSAEYLHQLQVRGRWSENQDNIKINQMVVIKSNQNPPMLWRLGRVTELLPGSDGIVRVVKVLTKQGLVVRPVVKLVPLPPE